MNEVRSHYQSRCLSRFNSVKRKQLERLRQRSDWFLSPSVRERNNSRKGRSDYLRFFSGSTNTGQDCDQEISDCKASHNNNKNNNHNGSSRTLHQKNSGNSVVTKASSEGAVLDAFSDGDSVFTDNTSRSESPASEPVWSHILKAHSRDIIHSDTVGQLALPELSLHEGSSGFDLSMASQEDLCLPDTLQQAQLTSVSNVEVKKEKSNAEDEEDDDDNTTPTGGQEEEDTIMASSLPDITQQSTSEDSSAQNEELDKDSPVAQQKSGEEPSKSKSDQRPVELVGAETSSVKMEGKDSMQEQQTDSRAAHRHSDEAHDANTKGSENSPSVEERQRGEKHGELVKCFLVERKYDDEGSKDS